MCLPCLPARRPIKGVFTAHFEASACCKGCIEGRRGYVLDFRFCVRLSSWETRRAAESIRKGALRCPGELTPVKNQQVKPLRPPHRVPLLCVSSGGGAGPEQFWRTA